jgi:hypothetical protein
MINPIFPRPEARSMMSHRNRRLRRRLLGVLAVTMFAVPAVAQLAVEQVINGLSSPVRVCSPPDDDRLFVVQ